MKPKSKQEVLTGIARHLVDKQGIAPQAAKKCAPFIYYAILGKHYSVYEPKVLRRAFEWGIEDEAKRNYDRFVEKTGCPPSDQEIDAIVERTLKDSIAYLREEYKRRNVRATLTTLVRPLIEKGLFSAKKEAIEMTPAGKKELTTLLSKYKEHFVENYLRKMTL